MYVGGIGFYLEKPLDDFKQERDMISHMFEKKIIGYYKENV